MTDQSAPYRFTVSVERESSPDGPEWWVNISHAETSVLAAMFIGSPHDEPFRTEAEARSHAAQVLAALHQATMEDEQ